MEMLNLEKIRTLLPATGTAGLEDASTGTSDVPRGKILKLKLGFNPNSSSVGTTVVVLLWSLVASGAVLALASAVLAHRFSGEKAPPPPPPSGGAS